MTRTRTAFFALSLWAPAALAAQDPSRTRVVTGFEFYNVSFDPGTGTKTIREMVVPIGIVIPISQRFTLDAGAYGVSVERTDEAGGSTTLSGLTDVILRAGYQLKPDVATLSFSVSLPTGQAGMTQEQLGVAGNVATDLIPYPVTSFGAGFTATTGLAFALPVGPWAIGLAGSYRYNSSYEPFVPDSGPAPTLTPGSEFRFRLGADRLIGQGRFTAGFTYSTFSQDEFGADRSSPGARIISQLAWSLPLGNNSMSFYFWDVYRGAGDSTPALPTLKQNTLALGAVFGLRVGGNTLRPSLEVRSQSSTLNGVSTSGSLIGIGAKYQIQAGRRLTLVPGVRFDTGKDSDIGFSGLSATMALRVGL